VRCRELEPGEEERLLDLLDGWPFGDGRRGRDFFRRYLEHDPAYQPRNVLVAEAGGALVSCVQVFPRTVRTLAGPRACGGIGSVFTAPGHRRTGTASELLRRAIAAMQARGMELSLLVAARLEWYGALGWKPLSDVEVTVRAGSSAAADDGRELAVEVDLDAAIAIAAAYSATRLGSVVRDRAGWEASLRLAGDPDEELRVAPASGPVRAYLRLADLDGARRALEWGRTADGIDALADLVASQAGRGLVLPPLHDAELERALRARGCRLEARRTGVAWMARSLGETPVPALLPAEHFAFWPADRF
jgi:predicted N-acetyltransferase YhbS